jgi:predicted nucleotidyltransferase
MQSQASLDRSVADVLAHFPDVNSAWLFGSQARGEARSDSDVDVALLLRKGATGARDRLALDFHRQIATIAARLEQALAGKSVDVVLLEAQGPIFVHAVLRDGRLLYDVDPEHRIDFESDAHVRYFDFLPTYELAARAAVGGMRNWLSKRR